MHTVSYKFLMKPEESAGCHQTLSSLVGSGHETIVRRQLTKLASFPGHPTAQFLIVKIDSGKAWEWRKLEPYDKFKNWREPCIIFPTLWVLDVCVREQLETQTDFSVNTNSSFLKLFLFLWRFHSESKPKLEPKEGKPTLTTKPKHRAHITAYAIPFDYRGRILTYFDENIIVQCPDISTAMITMSEPTFQ